MRALEAAEHQGRADRPQARHRDGDRRGPPASSSRPCAATSRPTAAAPSSPSPTTGSRTPAGATSPSTRSTPIRDGTLYDPFDGRADLAAGRVRFIGDADTRIAEDRLRVLRFFRFHAWYGRPPLDGPSFDACRRNAGALGGLSGERVAKELLRLLEAPAPADAVEAMAEAGALDHWLPEYAGVGRLERPDRAGGQARSRCAGWRRSCRPGADATAIGKRLKLSTQEALRLEVMLASRAGRRHRRRPESLAGRHLSPRQRLYADRLLLAVDAPGDWRAALALARSWTPPELPVSGGDALKLGLKPGPQGRRAARSGRALVDRGRLHGRPRRLPRRTRASGAPRHDRPGADLRAVARDRAARHLERCCRRHLDRRVALGAWRSNGTRCWCRCPTSR